MTANYASYRAREAKNPKTVDGKLDALADAIDYLARAVSDIHNDISRLKSTIEHLEDLQRSNAYGATAVVMHGRPPSTQLDV
ncbi:MAG: hypothetical protein ACRCVA_12305 [Phreatobacter sp.]